MYKRIVSLILALSTCFSLCSCGNKQETETEPEEIIEVETVLIEDANEFIFDATPITSSYELGAPSADIATARLYLGGTEYFEISVPNDIEYVTDYSKYIYAADNSFSVTVISVESGDNLTKKAGMVKAESIDKYTITTPDKYSGVAATCKYIPECGKAVIVRGYDLSKDGYVTAKESILNNSYRTFKNTDIIVADYWTQEITSLPIVDPEKVSIPVGIDFNELRMYKYDDGFVNLSKELRSFEDAIDFMEAKLCIAANENVAERYFKGKTLYYVEMNGFTVGIMKVNFNTTVCLFGYGETANANIVYYMKDFKISGE